MESTPSVTTTSSDVGHGVDGEGANILLLPAPEAQGHMNPMLQFGRRLAYHGLRPTLVATRYVLSVTPPPGDPFRVAAISDGFDAGGLASCPDIGEYISRLEAVGSETLRELIVSEALAGRPVRVLVYDPHMPWVLRVARAAGVPAAAFFSQPCSVNIVYGELWTGRLALPATDGRELVARGALGVELGFEDMPPFTAVPEFLKTSMGQFNRLEDADDVLVNSFSDIEPKEAKYMESTWRAKMIGPTLPSFYLDDQRLPSNNSYGFNLFSGDDSCMDWMENQAINSVVLVSYGTFSQYNVAQLEELGNGLCNSGKPFLWVVRSNESHKLSEQLKAKCGGERTNCFLVSPTCCFGAQIHWMHFANLLDLGEWGLGMQNPSPQYFTQLAPSYLMPTLIRESLNPIDFLIVAYSWKNLILELHPINRDRGSRLFCYTLWMELNTRSNCLWCASCWNPALGRPANYCKICTKCMGHRRASTTW